MMAWLEFGLSNALMATALAVVAQVVTRCMRRPQLAFIVWLLVLAKLLVPPLVSVPLPTLRPPVEISDPAGAAPPGGPEHLSSSPASLRDLSSPPPPPAAALCYD